MAEIVVVGEQIVDLIPAGGGLLRPVLGGGPANTAVAAARLGGQVAMVARLGQDRFATRFRNRLAGAGVRLSHLRTAPAASALALATVDPDGVAEYDFWLAGAADFGWQDGELPVPDPGSIVHFGSLAAFHPPGADVIERWALARSADCLISFDPNLRPVTLALPEARVRLARLARLANVIRVSDQDLRLAYPEVPPVDVARSWLDGERRMVILTWGTSARDGAGATVFTAAWPGGITIAAPEVSVVDTIGAGDTASGAVLVWLQRSGWPDTEDRLRELGRFMCAAAAYACTRRGADPPAWGELISSGWI